MCLAMVQNAKGNAISRNDGSGIPSSGEFAFTPNRVAQHWKSANALPAPPNSCARLHHPVTRVRGALSLCARGCLRSLLASRFEPTRGRSRLPESQRAIICVEPTSPGPAADNEASESSPARYGTRMDTGSNARSPPPSSLWESSISSRAGLPGRRGDSALSTPLQRPNSSAPPDLIVQYTAQCSTPAHLPVPRQPCEKIIGGSIKQATKVPTVL
jgi:hypothetical protein